MQNGHRFAVCFACVAIRLAITAAHRLSYKGHRTDVGLWSADPGADALPFLKETEGVLVTVSIILAPGRERLTFKDDRVARLDSGTNNVVRIRNDCQKARVSVLLYLHTNAPPLRYPEQRQVLNRSDLNTRASS